MSSVDRLAEPELPYALEFDKSSDTLYGIVTTKAVPPPAPPGSEGSAGPPSISPLPPHPATVTGFTLRQHVEKLGYQDFFFPNNSLTGFVKAINEKANGRYILAYRKHATIDVGIAAGALSVTAKTTRAWGGAPLTKEAVLNEIRRNKISPDRIIKQSLGQLFDDTQGIQVTLATAQQPVQGQDARLVPLLSGQMLKSRDVDSSESIDQREMFEFVVVEPGTPLLKKIPSTRGSSGMDVLGREIKPIPGKDIPFTKPFEGVEPSPDDENILVASIKGHPMFFTNGVKVDPVLSLPAVNINSGNVDYDGSVFVKENVENGFNVKATGDIHVAGQVERARLWAGGDIHIRGGVLGSEQKEEEEYNARLRCQGNLNAKFLSQTAVECSGKVIVAEYILHSQINARQEVLVGQERGRGCIIGGYCHSDTGVTAKVLGTEAYVPTTVSAGSKEKYEEFLQIDSELRRRTQEAAELKKLLEFIALSQPKVTVGKLQLDKTLRIQQVLLRLSDKIAGLEGKLNQYSALKDGYTKVNVTGKIYPNTTISINGIRWLCKQIANRKSIALEANKIIVTELES